jgi:signal transduction histidine kinase/ActR/RegA family two-component response regulator
MNQVSALYSIFFISTSLVSFFVAFLAFQRKSVNGAKELAWLMLATGTGAFWIIFETSAPGMAQKIFWSKLEYSGGLATPVLYLIFVLRFTGKEKVLSLRNILLMFLVPAFTFVLTLTNEQHLLIWSGFSPISEKTNLMEYYHGIWFWLGYIAYSYLLLLLSAIILIGFIIHHDRAFRSQAIIVFAGGLIPWIVSIIYLSGKSPVPGLDLTPFSITLSGTLAAYAILNFRFLDLIPVARETLVEILPDGIVAVDSQNRIQDINKTAFGFLAIKNKHVIGLPVDSIDSSRKSLLISVIDQSPVELIEIRDKDEIKTYSLIKQPIKNQPGSRLVIIHDISGLKQAEKELIVAKERAEESDKLKSAFLANMSHEIRTPLNGILGFTELLKMSDVTPQQQNDYLDIIKKGGDRMLNIINDIIDISRIESGQMKVVLSETNINDQIEFISAFLNPDAQAKGISLIFKNTLSKEDAIVVSDKEKIYAILANLVKNAIKFTRSGYVEYGYIKKENSYEFYVKDTGIGISSDQKDFIFERFRQGSESLTRNYEGTGLGLSISKAYAEMLGGNIWFESEFGKGSVFYFNLPISPDQKIKPAFSPVIKEVAKEDKIKSLVILIVEDNLPSEMLMTRLVRPFSKKILKVTTGNDAVEACRNNPDIDLVLMDIKLPEMDGYESTREIRKFNKDLIIIAQTAFGLMDEKDKAIEAGCNDFIAKPINRSAFLALIEKYFGN